MTVVAVGAETGQGGAGPVGAGGTQRARRSTPRRLRVGATVAAALVVALLAAVVAAFTVVQNAATTVGSRAATASSASDLYFALSDLDSEASRQVLLGDGTSGNGVDYGSSALTALSQYNARNQQADADLGQLADSSTSAQVNELAHEITVYRQFASQGISLDQDANAPAGLSSAAAQGYYSIASTLMEASVLPQAAALRDGTAAQLATAAGGAHRDAVIGLAAAAALGVAALLALLVLHRRMGRWFRRSVNPGVLLAAVLVAVLAGAAAESLAGLGRDSSDAAGSFAGYLAVTRARAAAYDADAAVTRYLLAPAAIAGDPLLAAGAGGNPVARSLTAADAPIVALATGDGAIGSRWQTVSGVDLPKITSAAAGGDVDSALALDTGTARGQDAFDFSYFDSSLLDLSNTRLAAFTSTNSASQNELADWGRLPWALAGTALLALAAGVRPRLSEFR